MLDLVEVNPDEYLSGTSQELLFKTHFGMVVNQTYYEVERLINVETSRLVRLSPHGSMKALADLIGNTSTENENV